MVALLTSEVVSRATAIRHGKGKIITLNCDRGQFRVDVHDTSRSGPVQEDTCGYTETESVLMLVSHLSTCWGNAR